MSLGRTIIAALLLSSLSAGSLVFADPGSSAPLASQGACLRERLARLLGYTDPIQTPKRLSPETSLGPEFKNLTLSPEPINKLAADASHWIQSDTHALYFYQHIDEFGPNAAVVFEHALKDSPFLSKKTRLVEGMPKTLMTFSFEKETHKEAVTHYYRPSNFTDSKWLEKGVQFRDDKLRESIQNERLPKWIRKLFNLPVSTATELKPSYLGNPEEERHMRIRGTSRMNEGLPPIEFKHKSYEISLDRVVDQIQEVSRHLKEKDAFHLHMVFELPKNYQEMAKLGVWFKSLNDYLTLTGMEEGLHASVLTEVAESKSIPSTPDGILKKNYKYVSAGLRGEIYGESKNPNFIRLGIELRDVTRDLNLLRKMSSEIADSISMRAWEQMALSPADQLAINPRETALVSEAVAALMETGLSDAWVKRMLTIEPSLTIPFLPFEVRGQKAGINMSNATFLRLQESRLHYRSELKLIGKEITQMVNTNREIDDDDVRMAIRMVMTEWARAARPSEIYTSLH